MSHPLLILTCIFASIFATRPEGKFFSEHQSDPYVPSGNQYKINETEDVDVVLIRAALEFLPPVLSVSPKNADLVQGLKDHALQLKTSDPLHEKRLKVAIASFEYLKVHVSQMPFALVNGHLIFNRKWSLPLKNTPTNLATMFASFAYFNQMLSWLIRRN